jgi:hypothetical protein
MSQLWGPALTAEVEYRRSKLTKVAAGARRTERRGRHATAQVPRASGVPRPRAA